MVAVRTYAHSIEAIERMLLARAEALARDLAPDGEKRGAEWVARNPCRADGGRGSFSINLATGRWADFAIDKRCSPSMPLLSLIAMCATGGQYASEAGRPGAMRWARDWLGLTDTGASPAKRQQLEAEAVRARQLHDAQQAKAAEGRRRAANAMWLEAAALDGGDPASLYLKGRGIDLAAFAPHGVGALRFAPRCRRYTGDATYTEHPAMLAAMHREGAPNGFAAVHRTFIRPTAALLEGRGYEKAFGKESKTILGAKRGATIRLLRGPTGRPLSRAPEGEWALVAEGIENALSAALMVTRPMSRVMDGAGVRVLASGTLENLAAIVLPEAIGGLYIARDNDTPSPDPKKPGPHEKFSDVCDALCERDLDLEIYQAPAGFKDFNDALTGKGIAA